MVIIRDAVLGLTVQREGWYFAFRWVGVYPMPIRGIPLGRIQVEEIIAGRLPFDMLAKGPSINRVGVTGHQLNFFWPDSLVGKPTSQPASVRKSWHRLKMTSFLHPNGRSDDSHHFNSIERSPDAKRSQCGEYDAGDGHHYE